MNKRFYYAGFLIGCLALVGCSENGSSDGVIASCDAENGTGCPDGLDCMQGLCLRPIQPGGSCVSNDTYCVDSTCTNGRCVASSENNGKPCDPTNPCRTLGAPEALGGPVGPEPVALAYSAIL